MMGERPAYTLETFLAKRVVIDEETGCWVCQGHPNHHGYQNLKIKGRTWRAHRWVYTQMRGPIPEGLGLDHLCKNAPCVNPFHLEPVTQKENNRRKRKPFCMRGHPMSGDNLYIKSSGRRACRRCALDREAAAWRRRAAECQERAS